MQRLATFTTSLQSLLSSRGGSRFRRNFVQVAKANVIAQIISLSLAPVLTRLYAPADFGQAALFASLLSLLSAFATWRFEWLIPNAVSGGQAAALVWLSLGALATTCIVAYLGLSYFDLGLLFGKTFDAVAEFALLVPFALFGIGVQQILQGWFTRENDLSAVSRAQVRQSVTGSVVSAGGGFAGWGAFGLIVSSALASWAGIVVLLRNARGLRPHLVAQGRSEIARVFCQFAGGSTISTGVSLINIASFAVIPFVLARYYGPVEVGWYALMYRVALSPSQLFTRALAQSFWAEAAQLNRTDPAALRPLFLATARRLLLLALPVGSLCVAGPLFVAPVFGEEWRGAGYILLALAPAVAAQIIVQPITHLIVHGKQHWKLCLDAAKLAVMLAGAVWLADSHRAIHVVVWWLSAIHVAGFALLFLLNLRCASVRIP